MIALYGYDGFLYSIGFLVAWLVVLLLVAEPLRNTGRYTMADMLELRLRRPPVRAAAALSTLTVSLFYLLAQMAGAGGLVSLLLGVSRHRGQDLMIAVVGLLMIFYVLVGGMKGTTWVQIVKATILRRRRGDDRMGAGPGRLQLLRLAASRRGVQPGRHSAVLGPGPRVRGEHGLQARLHLAGAGAGARHGGLPHVLMRLYTVPNAIEARRSVVWTIWLVGLFYLFTLVLGFGAMWLVGAKQSWPRQAADSAVPLLAFQLGGTVLLGIVAAVAFATILAVVAGPDHHGQRLLRPRRLRHLLHRGDAERGMRSGWPDHRRGVGIVAVIGGMYAKDIDVAFLVALAFAIAASANLPSILYSLFWPRFTTRGALWSMYGGLISSVSLIVFSPVVSGQVNPTSGASPSLISDPHVNFAFFPLDNPGIVSIPLAFFLGWLGSVTDRQPADPTVRPDPGGALTGVGAERGGRA